MKNTRYLIIFFFLAGNAAQSVFAQTDIKAQGAYKKMPAGAEYEKSATYQWFWGKNYRAEWITPVTFPSLMLDTIKGGLTPDAEGGGHQTTSLHLFSKDKKLEYAARSVDKSLAKLVPPIFKHTFIDHIANDEISMSNPYGALAVPVMAQSAGIYHANPKYYFMPEQPLLDSFNKKYGNRLYLFEEKPEKDPAGSNNFGSFDKYISSDKLMDKIMESSENQVDQYSFVKNRLFDMFIGDWDRHDKQWRWGMRDSGEFKYYEPVPEDRDQAFSTYDGFFQKIAIAATGMKYLKTFGYTIKEPETFDYERRILDRWFTNSMTLADWVNASNYLKSVLTDDVITNSVHQLPSEIFAIHGNTIIAKLKERRNHLTETATRYYLFLAREVEITGTQANDYFEINHLPNNTTAVKIYKLHKEGRRAVTPYYSRVFNPGETREIRLFGLSGNDVYHVDGTSKGARIRIIGGDSKDSIINVAQSGRLVIYDDSDNVIKKGAHTKIHTIRDSAAHAYDFDTFRPDKKGIAPVAFYDDPDRYYIGLQYSRLHHKWHKLPFASEQKLDVHYSLSQRAFSTSYYGLFPNLIGKLDVDLGGGYDAVRWINFFGLGNGTLFTNKQKDFYQLRTKVADASLGFGHLTEKTGIRLAGFFQSVVVISDTERYVAKNVSPNIPGIYNSKFYAGAEVSVGYVNVDNRALPTRGIAFSAFGRFSHSLDPAMNSYQKFTGTLDLYLRLSQKFSIAIRNGGGTVAGNPEFYQNIFVGGPNDLRGYIRERFWGKSGYYNCNELRYMTNFKSWLFNGKVGLLAYGDDGRVWIPNEIQSSLHTAYGGGILIAPFNKIMADLTYGKGDDGSVIQLRVIKGL